MKGGEVMKKILTVFLSISFIVLGVCQNVNATNVVHEMNVININEVLKNPEEFPDITVVRSNSAEFKEIIKNDNNLSDVVKNDILEEVIRNDMTRGASPYDYFTFYTSCQVTSTYVCKPYFYTYTYFGGASHEPTKFIKILNANIDRNYYGTSKQFGGTLYYNLESSSTIYWDVNGDFFNNGTTTFAAGASIGVGESTSISFSISNSSNHFAYCHKTGRFTL